MKKALSIILCLAMVLSVFTVLSFTANVIEADALVTGTQQTAMFILKNLNISQGVNWPTSHEGTKAIDCVAAKGVSAYAPFISIM